FEQFRWVIDAIYSPTDVFVIHIDKKSAPEFEAAVHSYVGHHPNVHFLQRRRINWGGWSQVALELDAMRTALAQDQSWSYFVNISGQDYPIKSHDEILALYAAAWPRNYIRAFHLDGVRETEAEGPHLHPRLKGHVFIEVGDHVKRTPLRIPASRKI